MDSAKTTMTKVLRDLIDPNVSTAIRESRSRDDLMLMVYNSRIAAFDNASGISKRFAEDLCIIATQGSYRKRVHRKNTSEIHLDVMRPVIINGIDIESSRDDLLDRTITVNLPPLSEAVRRLSEDEFWPEFHRVRPRILGALLDLVSNILAQYRHVQIDEAMAQREKQPRMKDLIKWVTAAEPALGWPANTFLSEYAENIRKRSYEVVENAEFPQLIPTLVKAVSDRGGVLEGTSTELINILQRIAGSSAGLPKSRLGEKLNRITSALRDAYGITYEYKESGRVYRLSRNRRAATANESIAVPHTDITPSI